jgi:hypothetical protein
LPATQAIGNLNAVVKGYAGTAKGAVTETRNLSRQFRAFEGHMMSAYENGLKPTKAELQALTRAQSEAEKKAKDYANTLRNRVKTSLDKARQAAADAKDEFDNFAKSQADSIKGFVSLSDAVKTSSEAESDYNDALAARSQAYAKLNLAKQSGDAQDYADALNDVAVAETNVTTAQNKRQSYGAAFAEQIASAKKFAENLQTLVGAGLQKAGLAELLNLGPVAGVQVTNELIAGTGSLTVAGLNESLAQLSTSGAALGATSANAFFGANLNAANANAGNVNNISINVNAGLVSNPGQVGRDIIEAIKQAERLSGQVFVSVR